MLFNIPATKRVKTKQILIIWIEDDEEGVLYLHKDAFVIKANVVNSEFNRILIDSRSWVDILFKSTLDEIGITNLRLEHINTSLKGLGERRLIPLGVIKLLITIWSQTIKKIIILDFIVVEEISPY